MFSKLIFKQIPDEILIENINNFDLSQTLDCGQCFRWTKISDNSYQGIAYGKVLSIQQEKNNIILKNTNKEDFNNIWKNYFDLITDYSEIWKTLSNIHPFLSEAYNYCPGIRILNQEPWETLCSFIISQNNNIPRIKKIISNMCELFGDKIPNSENCFSFPSPKILAKLSENDLSPIKCGFRAKYILDAASKISNQEINLESIKNMSIYDAEETLKKIKGVGPKVAQCTLLYGFHRLEAFPIDVWLKKIMATYFQGKSPDLFGKYAGIAQQYLYHYSRMNADKLF